MNRTHAAATLDAPSDGSATPSPPHTPPPRVGPYDILSVLGYGAMGLVYRGHDPMLGRDVAVKVVATNVASEPSFVARFQDEARALASVRHEHVVQVYSFGTAPDGACYMAMELVKGRTLDALIAEHAERGTFVPTDKAISILGQLASALATVHRVGVIHGDVKPSNVVIEDGTHRPVLIDFGVARRGRSPGNRPTHVSGTPAYMAPELYAGVVEPNERTDQYALGCTAFELLSGQLPFGAETLGSLARMHADAAPPRLSDLRPQLRAVNNAIARAIGKNPGDRFRDCDSFALALERARPAPLNSRQLKAAVRYVAPGERLQILVVERTSLLRERTINALRASGLEADVASARSAAEALETFENHPAGLVVMALDLPDLDGTEALSIMRMMPHGAQFRAICVGKPRDERSASRLSRVRAQHLDDAAVSGDAFARTLFELAQPPGSKP